MQQILLYYFKNSYLGNSAKVTPKENISKHLEKIQKESQSEIKQ